MISFLQSSTKIWANYIAIHIVFFLFESIFVLRKEQNSKNPQNNLYYQIGLLSVVSFLRFGHVLLDTQKQQ